jgi:hypothetical protein
VTQPRQANDPAKLNSSFRGARQTQQRKAFFGFSLGDVVLANAQSSERIAPHDISWDDLFDKVSTSGLRPLQWSRAFVFQPLYVILFALTQ